MRATVSWEPIKTTSNMVPKQILHDGINENIFNLTDLRIEIIGIDNIRLVIEMLLNSV